MIKISLNKSKQLFSMPLAIITIYLLISCGNSGDRFVVDYGILVKGEKQINLETRTNIIPYIVGQENQSFGIIITPAVEQKYSTYTVITFPQHTHINMEDKNKDGVFDKVTTPKENASGNFVHYYWLEEGDPLGVYVIEVYINDIYEKTIEFEVVPNET